VEDGQPCVEEMMDHMVISLDNDTGTDDSSAFVMEGIEYLKGSN
jgi:hypothetical protein